ncbi:hypothetical protein Tco_1190847 [Tanacetum coccineum]
MEFGTRFGMAPEFSGVVSHSREALARTMEGIILLILGGFAWCYTQAYIENGVTCIAKSSVTFLAKRSKIPTGAWPMAFSSVEPYVDEMFVFPLLRYEQTATTL